MSSILLRPLVEKGYYRFVVLLFNCLQTFGSYFCYDIPSVLQDQFQGNLTCPNATEVNGTVDCVLGMGMTPQQYNLLFAVHSWAGVVVTLMSGFLIDKLGNFFGIYLFSILCILGSALFALGSHFNGTPYLLPLMLAGRLLLGAGSGSVVVLQDRITAFWFKGKEMGMAFGVTIGFSRLGSVLNFFITHNFEQTYGLQWTLWGGALLCVFAFGTALIAGFLDQMGIKQLGLDRIIKEESSKIRIQDVKLLPLRYYLLTLSITFFYNIILPFVADASKFILDKFSGYSQEEAANVAGTIYITALVFTTVAGCLIDFVGLRGVILLACTILTLPVSAILAFTNISPLISTLWLGLAYSFVAVSTWPSIALVVPRATLGTAIGVTGAVSVAGTGISNLIIGSILGTKNGKAKIPLWRWQWMMIYLLFNNICCIITSVLLNISDHRQDGILNKTRKSSKQTEEDDDRESLSLKQDAQEMSIRSPMK
ncbi:major facilitator superfamily domain-containing protein 1-like [Takifugu rubripes]|uniref:major facilitator superfamily domain-containing protein 1-like n=1 Tax=Takifugu rubripes TaxID=31033 RepID=UPI000298EC10|nr:major facilitator superfamily domain-containing protein 1-like [Takifugu rubripes]|eukprot:XP_003961479.1 PREDICTED: major facilitator superfamily domain-containing protein 1-like [Takifugu rubripes]